MLEQSIIDEIKNGLSKYLEVRMNLAKDELIKQGHKVTGETEKSFKSEVLYLGNGVFEGSISVRKSGVILNYGVSAGRVPYGGRGGGGKSKYIEGLLEWAMIVRPELDEKERKGFVFAVANKAKKEGHPLKGSFAYSKNGRRTDWIDYSLKINPDMLFNYINLGQILVKGVERAFA